VDDVTRILESAEGSGAAATQIRLPLADEKTIEQFNRGYVCPLDAGPAWRAAHESGVDMALIEDALRMTPGERLREHQRALNLVLAVIQARPST
jgi:hypothetical protein